MDSADYLAQEFGTFDALFRHRVREHPEAAALVCGDSHLTYGELDTLVDRVAAALQRDGVGPEDVVSVCAANSIPYAAVFLGALRAGVTVAPLAPSSTPDQLVAMLEDCAATHLFCDADAGEHLEGVASSISARRVAFDAGVGQPWEQWLAPVGATPREVSVDPQAAFNLIYSSGTTGTPKAIVQSHQMRWLHVKSFVPVFYGPDSVTIVSTPLYSNTTLVSFLPALAGGGACVLMAKFDARGFLELAQAHRASVAMLVPVQYRRILNVDDFDDFDLSSFQVKFSTSAPFPAELKAETLARWPGELFEIYGMTEGGVACFLDARSNPHKLHTVGVPTGANVVKVIDESGRELGPGEPGELVGYSPAVMTGYLNQPDKTSETQWRDADGRVFIRSGDVAVIDEDGFVTLIGRKKDMIISGGFNVYPVDLEKALLAHPDVDEAAVVAAPSREWGETPVAFVSLRDGANVDAKTLRDFANGSLGKMQRISQVRVIDALPRSAIGKVLKRELHDALASEDAQS